MSPRMRHHKISIGKNPNRVAATTHFGKGEKDSPVLNAGNFSETPPRPQPLSLNQRPKPPAPAEITAFPPVQPPSEVLPPSLPPPPSPSPNPTSPANETPSPISPRGPTAPKNPNRQVATVHFGKGEHQSPVNLPPAPLTRSPTANAPNRNLPLPSVSPSPSPSTPPSTDEIGPTSPRTGAAPNRNPNRVAATTMYGKGEGQSPIRPQQGQPGAPAMPPPRRQPNDAANAKPSSPPSSPPTSPRPDGASPNKATTLRANPNRAATTMFGKGEHQSPVGNPPPPSSPGGPRPPLPRPNTNAGLPPSAAAPGSTSPVKSTVRPSHLLPVATPPPSLQLRAPPPPPPEVNPAIQKILSAEEDAKRAVSLDEIEEDFLEVLTSPILYYAFFCNIFVRIFRWIRRKPNRW